MKNMFRTLFCKKLLIYKSIKSINGDYTYYYAKDNEGIIYYKCVYAGLLLDVGSDLYMLRFQILRDIFTYKIYSAEFNWKKMI